MTVKRPLGTRRHSPSTTVTCMIHCVPIQTLGLTHLYNACILIKYNTNPTTQATVPQSSVNSQICLALLFILGLSPHWPIVGLLSLHKGDFLDQRIDGTISARKTLRFCAEELDLSMTRLLAYSHILFVDNWIVWIFCEFIVCEFVVWITSTQTGIFHIFDHKKNLVCNAIHFDNDSEFQNRGETE